MLARLIDKLSVLVPIKSTKETARPVRGSVRVNGKKYSASSIDANRIVIHSLGETYVTRQKFVFELTIDIPQREKTYVCVGLVESINRDSLTALYRVEGAPHRAELAQFFDERDVAGALRAIS
jgi:hypothetical protein